MAGDSGKLKPTNQQPTLSRFFAHSPTKSKPKPQPKAGPSTKRKASTSATPAIARRDSSPIDLTLDSGSDIEVTTSPPAKKRKLAPAHAHVNKHLFLPEGTLTPEPEPEPRTAPNSPAQDRWKYAASQPAVDRTASEVLEQQRKRARLAKALIADNNSFVRTRDHASSDTEGRRDVVVEEEEEEEEDDKFKELQKAFALKAPKGGGKGKKVAVTAPKPKKGKEKEVGPSGQTYTPLELQIKKLKEEHPDLLLMILVGYKYRFYGEDAKIAARHLGIIAYPDRNFITASIPDHRRDIHMKKLLSQGYKIGIVEQTETAALKKVSDTRNEVFERKLTHVYTAATYVDELDSVDDMSKSAPLLMCLAEHTLGGMGADEIVGVGMIVVCPSTGDVVWDYFKDGHMRTELETRMVHVKPNELYIPQQSLSKPTQRMLKYFVGHATSEHKIRVEHFDKTLAHSDAFDKVSAFYTDKEKASSHVASESFASGKLMEVVAGLPNLVTIALAHCIDYLATFNIADSLTATKFFTQFTTKEHMLLNGNTVTNLEIFQNDTDFTKHGSLMWILDKTLTKFGSRLLHSWVGKPLVNIELLKERTDAIEEAMEGTSQRLFMLRDALRKLPDLAKGLCRIQYGKCTPPELATLLEAFDKVARLLGPPEVRTQTQPQPQNQPRSALWRDILSSLPRLQNPVKEILGSVKLNMAADNNNIEMWTDTERYPEIADADVGMQGVEMELEDELVSIRKILKFPSLKWTSVLGDEFLVEYPKDRDQSRVPENWILHSSIKKARRFWTPKVRSKIAERARYAEQRQAAADKAYKSFLDEISRKHYAPLRDAVNKLAIADCLFALATVAHNQDYVRPEFVEGDGDELEIIDGRHPLVEALRSDPFVPNSISMGGDDPRCTVITGPNMGGKSSTVRMVALLAVMAQIGSYVPAKSMRLNMLDGVLTRMGASDELARGRSTFMVEMSETSDILTTATKNSLVILDELGRGTSTFDGMAIAHAVMEHLVNSRQCKTLFITHYPAVATELAARFPNNVHNAHMGFREDTRIDGRRDIAFMYKLTEGLAAESFGIECARLAGLPDDVLDLAGRHAERMRGLVEDRRRRNRARQGLKQIMSCLDGSASGNKKAALCQLSSLIAGIEL